MCPVTKEKGVRTYPNDMTHALFVSAFFQLIVSAFTALFVFQLVLFSFLLIGNGLFNLGLNLLTQLRIVLQQRFGGVASLCQLATTV